MRGRDTAGLGFIVLGLVLCAVLPWRLDAEPLRVQIAASIVLNPDNLPGTTVPLSYSDAVLISLGPERRFFRGVELEFTIPREFLPWRNSLALIIYSDLNQVPPTGVADIEARQYSFDPLPNKIISVFQVPLRSGHGLRNSPYVQVHAGVILPSSFPILFRVMPVIKGLNEEIETMQFSLTVRPVPSDEGAVRIIPRYPEKLPDRPFTVLIDGATLENPLEELLLREGEHHLSIISNDYRNENRVFMVERGRVLVLAIPLQDPAPLVIFEGPENARIFLDGQPVTGTGPLPVEPGAHEVRYQFGGYTIVRSLSVQRGKTYRLSLEVDLTIAESE